MMDSQLLHQMEGEPADFFAMRAFLIAMGKINDAQARAMIHWIAASQTSSNSPMSERNSSLNGLPKA